MATKKKTVKKSEAASMVLRLMDNDYSYSKALKTVLTLKPRVNKQKLERELNKFI